MTNDEHDACVAKLISLSVLRFRIEKRCMHPDCLGVITGGKSRRSVDDDGWRGISMAADRTGVTDVTSLMAKGRSTASGEDPSIIIGGGVAAIEIVCELTSRDRLTSRFGQWWIAVKQEAVNEWPGGRSAIRLSGYGYPWECSYCSHSRPKEGWSRK